MFGLWFVIRLISPSKLQSEFRSGTMECLRLSVTTQGTKVHSKNVNRHNAPGITLVSLLGGTISKRQCRICDGAATFCLLCKLLSGTLSAAQLQTWR